MIGHSFELRKDRAASRRCQFAKTYFVTFELVPDIIKDRELPMWGLHKHTLYLGNKSLGATLYSQLMRFQSPR